MSQRTAGTAAASGFFIVFFAEMQVFQLGLFGE